MFLISFGSRIFDVNMKILLVHIRLLKKGGLETRLLSYMDRLHKRGHDIHVCVYKVGKDFAVPSYITLHHLNMKLVPKPFRAFFFDKRLKKVVENGNFDFVLSLGRTSHQDAVLAPGNHLGYLQATGKVGKSINDRMQILMDKKAYDAPGVILACSEMMRDELITHYGVQENKIKVLLPPTDTARFKRSLKAKQQSLRDLYGLPNDKLIFLLGSSDTRKGLPLMLEVFKKLDPNKFLLIVTGPQKTREVPQGAKFLGFQDRIEELFAASDFTVHPALYEPYGQIVTESLLCGTPVIISDRVGAKSIVSKGNGMVLNTLNPKKWVETLSSLDPNSFSISSTIAEDYHLDLESHLDEILSHRKDKPH